jgi:GntR family transcriptional regulator
VEASVRPEAAYLRIARTLSERIVNGYYQPGEQLPPERRFAGEFGVSPMTLRRAMQVLAERGLVSAEQGRGTFVRSLDLSHAVFGLRQWREQWAHDSVQVKLLEASSQPATDRVAEMLGCSPGDRTLFLRRLIVRDAQPIMYHREHLVFDPRRPLVETELRITSLEGILESAAGSGITGGRLTIRACGLGWQEAGLLGEAPGSPALCLEHFFTDVTGAAISWGWFLCKAGLFWLETVVGGVDVRDKVESGPS